ncbi:4Fe-4S binding protein [Clostridium sp. 'White wine YQ']|uniref:4Fe-4S binding protein n=1 Tax=Clostridium sp. 'White wine YQ' TaxID=3027474 RepID=UPI00236523A1|nr:4Fe-4S binding protein [Clostridium sp. 'White wine YQ']MDD7795692.1 4Fe-4S binding protein [Clostridium sp. 'White wine YQ']
MKEAIRNYIKSLGVDDVGFAAVADYVSPNTPKIESFFPKAKSMIVMAYRELSTCESLDPQLAMNGRLDKKDVMRADAYKICHYLEDEFNAKLVSIPESFPRGGTSAVSLRHAAVAAGLGNFGRHNLVIHPEFGTRVTFTAIVTNLELESDEKIEENFCNNCGICVKNCPAKALDEEGKTDIFKCMKSSQPFSFIAYLSFLDKYIEADKEKRQAMAMEFFPYYQANAFITQYYCFNCLKLCPARRRSK